MSNLNQTTWTNGKCITSTVLFQFRLQLFHKQFVAFGGGPLVWLLHHDRLENGEDHTVHPGVTQIKGIIGGHEMHNCPHDPHVDIQGRVDTITDYVCACQCPARGEKNHPWSLALLGGQRSRDFVVSYILKNGNNGTAVVSSLAKFCTTWKWICINKACHIPCWLANWCYQGPG